MCTLQSPIRFFSNDDYTGSSPWCKGFTTNWYHARPNPSEGDVLVGVSLARPKVWRVDERYKKREKW